MSQLTPEQLAEIKSCIPDWHGDPEIPVGSIEALLAHIEAREAAVKGLLQELSLIADDRAVTYGDLSGKEIAQRAAAYGITLE